MIARASAASNGWVAQLAEQRTENPRVGGSIPPPATSHYFVNWETIAPQLSRRFANRAPSRFNPLR